MAWPYISSASISVYSKKDNPQPSAVVDKADLLKSILEISETSWVQVNTNEHRLKWIKESDLISAIDLSTHAYLRPQAELKRFTHVNSPNVSVKDSGGAWQILSRQDFWLQIKKINFEPVWVRNRHMQANPEAWENAWVFENASLLLLPQQDSKSICQVNAHTQVKIFEFSGHYAKVSACGGAGFMHLSKLLTKAQFAKRVRTRDNTWHNVARVNTNEVISSEYRPIAFSEIAGFELDSKIRFTRNMARVSVVQTKQERWAKSEIKNLGFFWWNMNASEVREPSKESVRVKSQKMFTGKIFDAVTSPTDLNFKIVSAQGIYLTRNGSKWEKLDFFADENYPLFITRTGRIFVGPYISYDQAKTFKPYIRWERLFSALGARGTFSLSKLRISDIQIFDEAGEKIKLVVYIGDRALSITSDDMGRTWQSLL